MRVNPRQQIPSPFALSNDAEVAKEGQAPALPRSHCHCHENLPNFPSVFPVNVEQFVDRICFPPGSVDRLCHSERREESGIHVASSPIGSAP